MASKVEVGRFEGGKVGRIGGLGVGEGLVEGLGFLPVGEQEDGAFAGDGDDGAILLSSSFIKTLRNDPFWASWVSRRNNTDIGNTLPKDIGYTSEA